MENKTYYIKIRAGPGSEEDKKEPFRYLSSNIPSFVKRVDEEPYKSLVNNSLDLARKSVLKTNKNLTLKLTFEID